MSFAHDNSASVIDDAPAAAFAMNTTSFHGVFTDSTLSRIESMARVVDPRPLTEFSSSAAQHTLRNVEILITSWGCPPIDADVLDSAPNLRFIVHAAGTVKLIMRDEVFRRGIHVASCAAANAVPVAEFTVASIVFGLKRAGRFTDQLHRTHAARDETVMPVIGTNNAVIGLVGASRVGREVTRMLRAMNVRTLISDPYITVDDAALLGAEHVSLDELCARCDVLSLHAPLTPDTRGMIGSRELGLLHDGALVVNTARGPLIDTDALVDEVRSGRLDAYLDVTDPEPLPAQSPLYGLPNVTLTPHIAGALGNEETRLGDMACAEIRRHIRGEALRHQVEYADLARIA